MTLPRNKRRPISHFDSIHCVVLAETLASMIHRFFYRIATTIAGRGDVDGLHQ
jgi:hypothetical protein